MKMINGSPLRRLGSVAFTLCASSTVAGGVLDFTFSPKPQFASNSCRAYAIVLAAGTLPKSPVPIDTVQELRAAERDMQARLESTAKQIGGEATPGGHEVWKRAIQEMSSGKIEAVVEYLPTIEKYYARVDKLTGNAHSEQLGATFSSAVVKTPVLTSVRSIGAQKYNPSHVVTIFGASSASANTSSLRALVILNPAVKTVSKRKNICELDDVKNDERWSAEVSLEPIYELTPFKAGYLVMWLRLKP